HTGRRRSRRRDGGRGRRRDGGGGGGRAGRRSRGGRRGLARRRSRRRRGPRGAGLAGRRALFVVVDLRRLLRLRHRFGGPLRGRRGEPPDQREGAHGGRAEEDEGEHPETGAAAAPRGLGGEGGGVGREVRLGGGREGSQRCGGEGRGGREGERRGRE